MEDLQSAARKPADAFGWWFVLRGREVLLDADGGIPCGACPLVPAVGRVQRLGELDGLPCYAVDLPGDAAAPAGAAFVDPKPQLDRLTQRAGSMLARALEIAEWDRSHRFCGACGAPTVQRGAAIVRVCTNEACRREHFPRVSPVVIVAVERGDEILLGRSHHFPPGLYSVLAGFVDAGESAEEAAHREIFEETRLQIGDLRYFASQPWPFPHSLMLGYQARYVSGEIVCAPEEIEDAAFFRFDRLPSAFPLRATVAHWLIRDFCRRHGRNWPDGA